MMYSLYLLALVCCAIAQQSEEGSGMEEFYTAPTNCSDNEKISVFYFSTLENRCIQNSTCPLIFQNTRMEPELFPTREMCEENYPATECNLHLLSIENGLFYIVRSKDGTVKAHYACSTYYEIVGQSERQCLYNGEWSGEEPRCTRVPCEDSPEVEGAKRKSCNNPGCFVIYSCKQEEGWELVSGKGYRICGKDGKWINELPVCARLKMMQDESEVSSEIKATDGEMNFEVRCLVEPRVPPTAIVQWIRNGEVNSNTHWQSDNKSLVLNFGKVQFNDAGKYECMMKLDKFIERSFQFVVISPPNDIAKLNLLLHFVMFVPYIKLEMTCVFEETNTKPTVEWYFNGELVEANNKYKIFDRIAFHPTVNFNVLQVTSPSSEDIGSYYCKANGDTATQHWFHLQTPTGAAKRSLDKQSSSFIISEQGPSSRSSICSGKTSSLFVGKFRREIKQVNDVKYILKIERSIGSLSLQKTNSADKWMIVDIVDDEIIPTNLSFRELYIFVTRTDENGRHVVSEIHPYADHLETILNTVCS